MPKRIGEILLDSKLINSEQLQAALDEQRITKEFIGNILVKRGYIKEETLLKTLSNQFDISYISIKNRYIDLALVRNFPHSLISKYKCFPIEQDTESVTVAVINPLDAVAIADIERTVTPLQLKVALTSRQDMADIIKRYHQYRNRFIRGLIEKTK